MTCLLRNK
jgi:hypothetical protein